MQFDNVKIHSFQLHLDAFNVKKNYWEVLDPKKEFGYDLNNVESLSNYFQHVNTK